MNTMTTVPFSMRLDESLKKQLEFEAQELDRPASYIVSKAIEGYVEARQYKRKAIEAAIKKAEKGVFVSEEAVTKWVDSWDTDNELPKPAPDIFLNKD